jgi:topoisomerase IV subunit B
MGDRLAARRGRLPQGSYCNTVPTPEGGTHEAGPAFGLLKAPQEPTPSCIGNKKAAILTADDSAAAPAPCCRCSSATRSSRARPRRSCPPEVAARLVEAAVKDRFDHWLVGHPATAHRLLLERVVERAEERQRRRQESKEQAARRRPASCACRASSPTAAAPFRGHRDLHRRGRFRRRLGQAGALARDPGGAAAARQDPQRRQRLGRQAAGNQELADLTLALGCGTARRLPTSTSCATTRSSS